MVNNEILEELILAKIVALLHDPPYKMWVITAAFSSDKGRFGRVIAKKSHSDRVLGEDIAECRELVNIAPGERAHEIEAKSIIRNISPSDIELNIARLWRIASRADNLASAFERWILPPDIERDRITPPDKLVNPFNPKYTYPIKSKPENDIPRRICNFIKVIREAVRDAYERGGITLAYHVLYTLLEPLWYLNVGDYPLPADTRVPTHTIFDHIYATAAMVNWVQGYGDDNNCGVLVLVDLAGVQEWISASRKTWDLWAASWLASALAWTSIRSLVEKLGPDIMLIPTARLNPFYLSWLHSELKDKKADRARKILEKIIKDLGMENTLIRKIKDNEQMDHDSKTYIPQHPTMPATITLILPAWMIESPKQENKIKREIMENLKRGWSELVKDLSSNLNSSHDIADLLDTVGDDPPMPLRITIVKACTKDPEFKKFVESIENNSRLSYENLIKNNERLLFPYLISRLKLESKKSKKAYVRAGTLYSYMITVDSWERKERYRQCTMCSVRPALPDKAIEPLRQSGEYNLITSEEHLCPYCLMKRLAGRGRIPSMLRLVHSSLLRPSTRIRKYTPPVNAIASLDTVVELCKLLTNDSDKCNPDYIGQRGNVYTTLLDILDKEIDKLWDLLEEYFRNKQDSINNVTALLNEKKEIPKESIEKALELSSRYYAIIYADGDSIGDAIFGALSYTREDTIEYWKTLKESIKDSNIKSLLDPRILAEESLTVGRILLEEGETSRLPTVIPTPAYLQSLSMSLMVTAHRDIMAVEKLGGLIIYSGGDDLLAISPTRSYSVAIKIAQTNTSTILPFSKRHEHTDLIPIKFYDNLPASGIIWSDIVAATRRNYWALENQSEGRIGFHLLKGKMPIPALNGLGRSYAVVLTHIKEPMILAIKSVRYLEEEVKKGPGDSKTAWKDSVGVAIIRGRLSCPGYMRNTKPASPISSDINYALVETSYPVLLIGVLTLTMWATKSKNSNIIQLLGITTSTFDKPVFTASLLYDLLSSEELITNLISKHQTIARLVMERLIIRNMNQIITDKEKYARQLTNTIIKASNYWPKGPDAGVRGLINAWKISISSLD